MEPTVFVEKNCGIWLLIENKEYFLSYKGFPWFKDAKIGQLLNVKEVSIGHFYWPDLDVDLSIEIIEHSEKLSIKS